jgi:hypothetical protein
MGGACESSYELAIRNRCERPIRVVVGRTTRDAVKQMAYEEVVFRVSPGSMRTLHATGAPAKNSPRYLGILRGDASPRLVRFTQRSGDPSYSVNVSGRDCE